MKILVFYDNFVRDYRGLLLLTEILMNMKHRVYLKPLWNNAVEEIKKTNPDTVVMGQVGEFSTSQIGTFCAKSGINLVINTSEMVTYNNQIKKFFSFNFSHLNHDIIDLQTIPNTTLSQFVKDTIPPKFYHKYRDINLPRLDLSLDKNFRHLEISHIQKKYNFSANTKIFLYVSSFIYDDAGGQVSPENHTDLDEKRLLSKEKEIKYEHTRILKTLIKSSYFSDKILLIKKHPWDKSDYFKQTFTDSNCIIVDANEYISPLIALSDMILHTESTVALEAWIQNKKTISLLPHFDGDLKELMFHMKHELIAKDYKQLKQLLKSYPDRPEIQLYLKKLFKTLDGKATIQLAKAIDALQPKATKEVFRKNFKETLLNLRWKMVHMITATFKKKSQPSGYIKHFLEIEKNKKEITKIYRIAIKNYIRTHKREITNKQSYL